MKIQVEHLPKSKVKLKVSIENVEASSLFERALVNLGKSIEIPGFRKGCIPGKILKEKLPRNELLNEVAKIAAREALEKAQREFDLQILDQPQALFQKIDEREIEATFEFSILPKANIRGWKEIVKGIKKREVKVEPSEVEAVLKNIQRSRTKFIRKSTCAQNGDEVLIDGEIRWNGVKIENGDIKDQRIVLGERRLVPGFEENLLGACENEEKTFFVKIPEDFWQKNWAGKNLEFKIKVKAIFKRELPPLNDEFARSLGNFENLEELRASIKEGLLIEKTENEKMRWVSEIISKIVDSSGLDLPEVMIKREQEILFEELKNRVEENGLSFSDYLAHLNLTQDGLKNSLKSEAERILKRDLVIIEIAKEENIEVSQAEIEEKINQVLKGLPSLQEAQKIDLQSWRDYFYQKILFEKISQKFESLHLESSGEDLS